MEAGKRTEERKAQSSTEGLSLKSLNIKIAESEALINKLYGDLSKKMECQTKEISFIWDFKKTK